MLWKLTNVALDPTLAMRRRQAPKLEMEPTVAGQRIRLRQSITITDKQYQVNETRITQLVTYGVLKAEPHGVPTAVVPPAPAEQVPQPQEQDPQPQVEPPAESSVVETSTPETLSSTPVESDPPSDSSGSEEEGEEDAGTEEEGEAGSEGSPDSTGGRRRRRKNRR